MGKILITAPGRYSCSVFDEPKVGCIYYTEPAVGGSNNQNRLFHKLLQLYWSSGQHSYNAKNLPHFKKLIKLYLGEGKEKYYELLDEEGNLLPEPKIRYRIKSWADYTKKQRANLINNVISEMLQIGINSKEFFVILDQLEQNSMRAAV